MTDVPASPCVIHSGCIHRESCDRSMCLLFFQPTTTFDDLKDVVRGWLRYDRLLTLHRAMPREPPTGIDRFVLANQHLFKTTIVYIVMLKVIFIALMEVLDE